MSDLPHVYRLSITLADGVYHATRELGRSYQTGEYMHNYALTYALGLATAEYHDAVQVPRYRDHLAPLRERGIYVTPAKPERVRFATHTFKFADTRNHVEMLPSSVNVPSYGRARELAPESQFTAYVLSRKELKLPSELRLESPLPCQKQPNEYQFPRWIRLGKWFGKAEVNVQKLCVTPHSGAFTTAHPLNPLDTALKPKLFDLVNMPPVSIINNARFEGESLALHREDEKPFLHLPTDLGYRFP